MKRIPRISVCMITYNQEKLVGRAIDSLLAQGEYLYEICINDDCSTDRTFDVLLEYQKKYPNIVKPVRNEHNLGIFQNIEASWKRPSGDLVYRLAGDDECPKGYFKAVCEYIDSHNIDVYNESACIYGDYVEKHSAGVEKIYKNNLVQHHDAVRLYCRSLISNRSACYSTNILRKFITVSEGRSYKVEKTQEVELSLFTDKNYYIPIVGNIYYSSIGVSASGKIQKNNIQECYEHMSRFLEAHGYKLRRNDRCFFKYRACYGDFVFTRSLNKLAEAIFYYVGSIELNLGVDGMQLGKLKNAIQKRKSKN